MAARKNLVLFVALAAACATTPKAHESSFPTQAKLDALLAKPVPPAKLEKPYAQAHVESWTLTGPQPKFIGSVPSTEPSPFGNKTPSGLRVTEEANCVARETARFVEAEGAFPNQALSAYIDGWCGFVGEPRVVWNSAKPSQRTTVRFDSSDCPPDGCDFGAAEIREPRPVVVVVIYKRKIDLTPIPVAATGETFTLSGELVGDAVDRHDGVEAGVDRGPYGYEDCTVDTSVELPKFRVTCPSREQIVRFDFGASVKGSTEVADDLWEGIRFQRPPGLGYLAPVLPSGLGSLSGDSTKAQAQFARSLNRLRAQAHLDPLRFEPKESTYVVRALPRYDDAGRRNDLKTRDTLLNGLEAGWAVQGDIIRGTWMDHRFIATDPRGLFEYLTVSPTARELVYARGSGAVALAFQWLDKKHSTSRVFAFEYTFLPHENYNRLVSRAYARLDEERRQLGHTPLHRIGSLNDDMKDVCSKLAKGHYSIEKARTEAVQLPAWDIPGSRWVNDVQTYNLDSMDFPPAVLQGEPLHVALCVAPLRKPGEPWFEYEVVYTYIKG